MAAAQAMGAAMLRPGAGPEVLAAAQEIVRMLVAKPLPPGHIGDEPPEADAQPVAVLPPAVAPLPAVAPPPAAAPPSVAPHVEGNGKFSNFISINI